ncbi:hypothetical protein WJX81_003392 [Elliptochloris bilobata]|uniref:AB hydrolase-1 domain-containing protein n=1 Tax=Elliptochloris bilobata TaxID=381761 RepID=A0AAW1RGF6_9CHLO
MAAELAGRFRCLLVDLQGQGASPVGSARGNMLEHHATDCLAVVSALQLAGCLAFGHSSGGLAATIAEARRPGTFAALYLYEAVIFRSGSGKETSQRMEQLALRRRRHFASRETALASFTGKPPFSSFSMDALREYVFHGLRDLPDAGCELACSPESEARVYGDVNAAGAALPEGRIQCPVTIACGVGPPNAPFSAAERAAPGIAQWLPNARCERYEDLEHMGPMQEPSRAVAAPADAAASAALHR